MFFVFGPLNTVFLLYFDLKTLENCSSFLFHKTDFWDQCFFFFLFWRTLPNKFLGSFFQFEVLFYDALFIYLTVLFLYHMPCSLIQYLSSSPPDIRQKNLAGFVMEKVILLMHWQVRDMLGDGRLIKRRIRDGKGWVSEFSLFLLGLVFVGNNFFFVDKYD